MIEILNENNPILVEKIVRLENEAFGTDGLTEWTLVPLVRHGRVYCLTVDGMLVGVAQYIRDWEKPNRAYLVGIAVSKSHQGRGWGTALMKESMLSMRREGIEEMELTVDPANQTAIEVYQRKLGFEVLGYREDEYGKGIHRLVMGVRIDNGG